MSLIKISNLNTADSDLSTDADSFLTDIEATEATSVVGGKYQGGGGYGDSAYLSLRRHRPIREHGPQHPIFLPRPTHPRQIHPIPVHPIRPHDFVFGPIGPVLNS